MIFDFACTFFADGKPIPKGNHRAFVRGKKAVITDARGASLSDWENSIRIQARNNFNRPLIRNKGVFLKIVFVFQHPKNHFTSKGKPSKLYREKHITRPDADKLLRAVCDALTGTVYEDDSQVCKLLIDKDYDITPGVRISIYIEKEQQI